MLNNLKLISAGAGSGKTYRLTEEMIRLLTDGGVRPSGIIATTFTKRAAAELKERVRVALLRKGMTREANELTNALIGTVHGLGVKLLRRFAYEAGVSPNVDIIADGDGQRLFNLSMADVIKNADIVRIEGLCVRLSLSAGNEKYNWRKDVLALVEIIRGNNFSEDDIARSKAKSWETLATYLPEMSERTGLKQYNTRVQRLLKETREQLLKNEADSTKKTHGTAQKLRDMLRQLKEQGALPWSEYAKLARIEGDVGAKSRELVKDLAELGAGHGALAAFQDDLKDYQDLLFEFAARAIKEYDGYKKKRGRIDYTDMEVLVLKLLDHDGVRETLKRELDLLMVDEFQDTSPIQLAIFLRLSELARQSIWVGDPKQSIYGFRGAEPRLMAAVMEANGPIDPSNIQKDSWRSREDIVYACNSLFVSAFPEFRPEEVSLEPVRLRAGGRFSQPEGPLLAERSGLIHWHFEMEGSGRYAKEFLRDAVGKAVRELLENPPPVLPKGGKTERWLRPGDVAILCRSNRGCEELADSLAKQGIPAAIARKGLLQTAEATFILACLKYMLNPGDTLSVAEILLFGAGKQLPDIIDHRLVHLAADDGSQWSDGGPLLKELDTLRTQTPEHSTSEMLNLILERLDVRRTVVGWGRGEQRMSNLDEIRHLAVAYEDNCHRQHSAASLGGFLLYLDQLRRESSDEQGASENPEAINVLTYHRSKGLEWPVVICYDLDQSLRESVWGRAVVPDDPELPVDLGNPLGNRWLRYWVYPYGKLSKDVPLVDAVAESPWQEISKQDALAEEARLLYVGMTRARDYLILPTGKNGAGWIDRVYGRGGKETVVLSPDTTDTPFTWNGRDIDKSFQTWLEPRRQPGKEMQHRPVDFIHQDRPGRRDYGVRLVDESYLLQLNGVVAGTPYRYAELEAPEPATDVRLLSQCIGHFIAGVPDGDVHYRLELARQLLENFQPGGTPDPQQLLIAADGFQSLRDANWPDAEFHTGYPVRGTVDQKQYAANVDWLGLLPNGECILLHDVCLSEKQYTQQSALPLAHLKVQATLVARQLGLAVSAAYLHFPAYGSITEVRL